MEYYSLVIKGTLGTDIKARIHYKTGRFPLEAKLTSYTNNESIYRIGIQGGMDMHMALTKWFCSEPSNPPFPEGTLLHFNTIVP